MIAREDNAAARPNALGRGLDTLMGDRGDRTGNAAGSEEHAEGAGPSYPGAGGTPSAPASNPHGEGPQGSRPLANGIAAVGGLIAGGAAGAVALAAFTLLGVKAVLSMQRRNRLL